MTKAAQRVRARTRIVTHPLNMSDFTSEVDRLRGLYCGAWERNWGFVAPTDDEFRRIARELKPILDPRCAVGAEIDGRMVACAVAIPDINQAMKGTNGRLLPLGAIRLLRRARYIDQARLMLLGVDPEFRSSAVHALLLYELNRQLAGGPYRRLELSWVLENNRDINRLAQAVGARLYKTYRIFRKALA
jgi:hypothetical protein